MYVALGEKLTPAIAFPALSLLNMLIHPLTYLVRSMWSYSALVLHTPLTTFACAPCKPCRSRAHAKSTFCDPVLTKAVMFYRLIFPFS
jgi:hypothetical protein